MSAVTPAAQAVEKRSFSQKMLDGIEKAGNKVPHPVMIFVYLIILVILLSAVLNLIGVSVTEDVLVPVPIEEKHEWVGGSAEPITIPLNPDDVYEEDFVVEEVTTSIESLLSVEGLRFIFTSFVNNFANFSVVAVIFVAMIGVGVAETAGLMAALIRGLVRVAPRLTG
jgi:aminobenzoyl-glutamate transport protein